MIANEMKTIPANTWDDQGGKIPSYAIGRKSPAYLCSIFGVYSGAPLTISRFVLPTGEIASVNGFFRLVGDQTEVNVVEVRFYTAKGDYMTIIADRRKRYWRRSPTFVLDGKPYHWKILSCGVFDCWIDPETGFSVGRRDLHKDF